MSDAQSDIAQGWMPAELPPSTRNIRVTHHLDTGQAEGSFEFDPSDWSYFSRFGASQSPKNLPLSQRRQHFVKEGYSFGGYSNRGFGGIIAVSPQGRGYFWTPEYD